MSLDPRVLDQAAVPVVEHEHVPVALDAVFAYRIVGQWDPEPTRTGRLHPPRSQSGWKADCD